MKSLLEALEEGRLIELPDGDKDKAFEFLANVIEAIPDIGTKSDLLKSALERETQSNTGLGKGVACPHCRTSLEGELRCAVGWSPKGIAYGAPDGKSVHLVVMYYVPDSERNSYLKEISNLAKAISGSETIETLSSLPDIHTVRDKLLDWVSLATNETVPDAKARMIKLEAKQAIAANEPQTPPMMIARGGRFLAFRLVLWSGGVLVLANDPRLAEVLEKTPELPQHLSIATEFDLPEYRIAILSESIYASNRKEYEAVAIQII
jgi:mannitol/fructose-specific phosphotransferase system IIA component (Ntr-type)